MPLLSDRGCIMTVLLDFLNHGWRALLVHAAALVKVLKRDIKSGAFARTGLSPPALENAPASSSSSSSSAASLAAAAMVVRLRRIAAARRLTPEEL